MEDLAGKQIGPYQVIEPIGEGGMASVFKAYQPGMDRYVALKILPQHLAKQDAQFVARFTQEAKVVAKLQHPHILPVFDFGEADGYTYLTMPLIESGTVKNLLVGKPLPFNQARSIISQVGDALDYAHSRGLVHRDIKPSNVLIDERGNCLLTDFGIAKIVEATTRFTNTGGILGTPVYMSPEQGRGTQVDGRSDIYALGVMLYEMVTGRAPFDADTPMAVIYQHIHDPLPLPRKINPNIPPDIERVILKALAKNPNDRFQTAKSMVETLNGEKSVATSTRPAPKDKGQKQTETLTGDISTAKPEKKTHLIPMAIIGAIAGLVGILVLITGAVTIWPQVINRLATPTSVSVEPTVTSSIGVQATDTSIPAIPIPQTATEALGPGAASDKVTINWWHIQTNDDQKALWQSLANEYMVAHPNIEINITVLDNDTFKTKVTTLMKAGAPPDLFQSWGGGVMNAYAEAGLIKDITADLQKDGYRDTIGVGPLALYSYKGRNYGVPFDLGMVGIWYNKNLFAKAGITRPPTTWADFLTDVKILKDAGITPIALGEGDKWPGAFWWEYLAVRVGGQAAFDAAQARTGSFSDPAFVEAGGYLRELIALEPFQDGFLGATYTDEAATIGDGKAAMELMGQWGAGVAMDNSADRNEIADSLAWFPFPSVEGGKGNPADALGGGNGFVVGMNAPPETVDFLKFLINAEHQRAAARIGMSPVVKDAQVVLTDPLIRIIQQNVADAPYLQLYYDQYMPPSVGSVINDSIYGLFAGSLSPQEAAKAIDDAAAAESGR